MLKVAENDILRDEGEAFCRKLESVGVTIATNRYHGMILGFGLLNALTNSQTTKTRIIQAADEIKKYLN